MALMSQCLSTNARLQAVAVNNPAMFAGETGLAVGLVQQALSDLGYAFPISFAENGAPDGKFGDETFSCVKQFQSGAGLETDGVVGKVTLATIDGLLADDEAGRIVSKFDISGLPAPRNLPKGVTWRPKPYKAVVRRLVVGELLGHQVSRAVLAATVMTTISVRPYPDASVSNAHWDPEDRVLRFTPGVFDPKNLIFIPPAGLLAHTPDAVLLHELVHTMRQSIGKRLDDQEAIGPIRHPPWTTGEIPEDRYFLKFDFRREFNAIVITNTYISEKEPTRPVNAFHRNRLLLRKDWQGNTSHMPLPDAEDFHKTPRVLHFLRLLWREQPNFCEQVARADAPFNPLRDARKLLRGRGR